MRQKSKKKTLTYYGAPAIRKKAMAKAKKEGLSFGEKVDQLLQAYNESPVWRQVESGQPVTTFPFNPEVTHNY